MPVHVIDLIISGLNKNRKSLNGSKILIVGVAYKKDIEDCRESPALDIIELLQKNGSNIKYYDPYVQNLSYNHINLKSLKALDAVTIKSFDASVIVTDHSNIDFKIISENSSLVIDTRNVFHHIKSDNIIRLGQG